MSKASSSTTCLEEMLECCICTEEYKDPRVLPCIHTFCQKCLEKTGQGKQPGEIIPCPVCRQEFRIPAGGCEKIQKNFFMEKLIDFHRLNSLSIEKSVCDSCSEGEGRPKSVPSAALYCIECRQKLCENCCKVHKTVTFLKNHQLIDLKSEVRMSQLTSVCGKHKSEPVKLYCTDCSLTICMICHAESHQGHKCSDVNTVGEDFRLKLKKVIEQVSVRLSAKQQVVEKFGRHNEQVLEEVKLVEKEIVKQANDFKQLIDKHAEKLMKELELEKMERLKLIQSKRDDMEREMAMLQSFERYANEINRRGSAADICRTFVDMNARAEEIQKDQNCETDLDLFLRKSGSISFVPSTFVTESNAVGMITRTVSALLTDDSDLKTKKEKAEDKEIRKSKPKPPIITKYQRQTLMYVMDEMDENNMKNGVKTSVMPVSVTNKLVQIPLDGVLQGVTLLENKIYVVSSESNRIFVYLYQNPFHRLEIIELKQMKNPEDITACKMGRSIFVSDYKNGECLWKVQIPGKQISKWPIDGQPETLSNTSSDELMILTKKEDVNKAVRYIWYLDIYRSSDVCRLRRISLPKVIKYAWHAVQSSKGNFIITCEAEMKASTGFQNVAYIIAEMSIDGNIVRYFQPSTAKPTAMNWRPVHLAIDEDDRIFVADCSKHNVFWLNSNMADAQRYLTEDEHGVCWPFKLCYSREKQQLIVGHLTSGSSQSCPSISIFSSTFDNKTNKLC